jgi:hypothetical protein
MAGLLSALLLPTLGVFLITKTSVASSVFPISISVRDLVGGILAGATIYLLGLPWLRDRLTGKKADAPETRREESHTPTSNKAPQVLPQAPQGEKSSGGRYLLVVGLLLLLILRRFR